MGEYLVEQLGHQLGGQHTVSGSSSRFTYNSRCMKHEATPPGHNIHSFHQLGDPDNSWLFNQAQPGLQQGISGENQWMNNNSVTAFVCVSKLKTCFHLFFPILKSDLQKPLKSYLVPICD